MKQIAPRALPALSQLLPVLGDPTPAEVAAYLDVSERTVYHWRAQDRAPRAALLALFWESSYGLSALDAELFNTAMVFKRLSESQGLEMANLQARITRLERIGDFGCANDTQRKGPHSAAPWVSGAF
ncbi:helix-turn-helix domain-containing protein [Acidovorax sp. GBBC 1281]|nr:helix-turn-helix domain-containing protein [Acidovorax sp. GBBC 1281]WCM95711.1 helix-turn-helix domain-containing protein [Acidovorax sp. GBBC 1281]